MKLYLICFSPTGGTRSIALALATGLAPDGTEFVDLTARDKDFSQTVPSGEEIAIIAVPSFGGRVPPIAAERLEQIRAGGARAILVCSYGNRAFEDTLLELRDLARKAGFCPIAAVAAVAEHSVVRKYAAGRPDAEDLEQLRSFALEIRGKIDCGLLSEPSLPGNRPYRESGGSGVVPFPTEECVGCGECALSCPAGAIDPDDPKKVDPKKCISCMRCVRVCPCQARRIDPRALAMIEKMLEKPCAERKSSQLFF